MPTNLARRKAKPKKEILTPDEVANLIAHAKADKQRGIFYAFPFLTGVRVSEQLGLLWEDINLDRNIILIRRVLERDGTTTDQTKTEAGEREIPICTTLREMLLEWRLLCPRLNGELYRVFPGPGQPQQWPLPRKGGAQPDRQELTVKGTAISRRVSEFYRDAASVGVEFLPVGPEPADPRADALKAQLDDLLLCIAGHPNRLATPAEALRVQRLVEGMLIGKN